MADQWDFYADADWEPIHGSARASVRMLSEAASGLRVALGARTATVRPDKSVYVSDWAAHFGVPWPEPLDDTPSAQTLEESWTSEDSFEPSPFLAPPFIPEDLDFCAERQGQQILVQTVKVEHCSQLGRPHTVGGQVEVVDSTITPTRACGSADFHISDPNPSGVRFVASRRSAVARPTST